MTKREVTVYRHKPTPESIERQHVSDLMWAKAEAEEDGREAATAKSKSSAVPTPTSK